MRKVFLALAAVVALAGCAADPVWAPDSAVKAAAYHYPGPTRLTLFTMISNETGAGGHSSLMINASQRVIWDPSGSFHVDSIPERNDLLYGATPAMVDAYTRYHARETWHVVIQEKDVSPEVAEQAFRLAQNYGAVPNAFCANSTAHILQQLPGFEGIRTTMYPVKLEKEFAKLPGVSRRVLHEYDSDDNSHALDHWDPARFAATKRGKTLAKRQAAAKKAN
ncbi:hypothetical protein U5922_010500 [Aquicoccus sp. G2-2]|uniref:hypothetical protein n=1 Tax=Aquicoccus sp. G2-2 TaxID=3092120 RepID=UPI002ADF9E9E|nr:hypothetical protein [Aquicoccus sp. G2-2]MEA1113877.1 hypothetical protein [Aquicoccus sp. G2-2]